MNESIPEIIELQITDWYIEELDKNIENINNEEPEKYNILIYGICNDGKSVSINIINYEPYFYVKGPVEWDNLNEKEYDKKLEILNITLREETYQAETREKKKYSKKIIPKKYINHYNNLEKIKKKEFWGFTNDRIFNFIKVKVKSFKLYNSLKYYFQSRKSEGFKLYESNIAPFLRYAHEFNIKPCGWISVNEYDISDNETRCDYNITTSYENVTSLNINKIAPLLIASFDIECTSSHGDFPLAIKDYKKVVKDLSQIVKAGYEYNADYLNYWLKYMYVKDIIIDENIKINKVYLKDKKFNIEDIPKKIEKNIDKIINILNKISQCNNYEDNEDNEDIVNNNENINKNKLTIKERNIIEDELNNILVSILPPIMGDKIIQIGTTVHRYGSDKIIYKNIVSLNSCDDIDDCKVIVCKTEKELIMQWKNVINELNPDILIGYNIFGFDMNYIWDRAKELKIIDNFSIGLGKKITRRSELKIQELASSALGENVLKYFDLDGIIMIDLLKVMQKDHKLDSYKLDNVASIFLGDNKNDLKPNEIFEKFKGTSSDRCEIAKYCIQDCALINRLLHKLKIIENNIGMGNVCYVPLNYLFRRGQGIKIFSLLIKQCMEKGYLVPVVNYNNDNFESNSFEGAVVLDPKEGMYLNDPIVVFDYGSLYPSSMISKDLSHDRYILDEKYIIDDPNIEYIDVSYDIYEGKGDKKKKSDIKTCKFAKYKNGKKGIIAEILIMLLEERKKTKNKIEYKTININNNYNIVGLITKNNEDIMDILDIDTNEITTINKSNIIDIKDTYSSFEKDVFDALQLAYKVTANSLYGQIGAKTSPIYLKEIAACTTATGREMIMLAKEYVEKNYNAEVIYGDTDSIFCKFPLKDSNSNQIYGKQAIKYAIEIGKDVEKNIAKIMPYPQKLNYEKSLYPFIILSKKRYVGNLYEYDDINFKQKSMGIVLKRRDNANIVKKIYGGIIDILLNKQDLNESFEFLNDELNDLVNGNASISDLIVTKKLSASYSDPKKIAHKVLADRIAYRDPGNKPEINDRIPYVYIVNNEKNILQGDKIENPEYIIENNITPDYLHYITNQIMKPILQLYSLCLDDIPNYDKDENYWKSIDNELKLKDIYKDDIKRQNRINNLKLKMVKELLFDKYINILSEPKIKKIKTLSQPKIKLNENVNNIIKDADNIYYANIKITKKIKLNKIELSYYLTNNNKKKLLKEIKLYDINIDKYTIIINNIIDIINNNELNNINYIEIKLINFELFIKEFKLAVSNYKEMENNELNNNNLFVNGINKNNNDIGLYNMQLNIIKFHKLIEIKNKFKFI